jgi:hypothetical protein
MALSPISNFILSDPNYRWAVTWTVIDKTVCEFIANEFGEVKIKFQAIIEAKKINVTFFHLNKYYLTYLNVNKKELEKLLEVRITEKLELKKSKPRVYIKFQ